MKLSPKQQMFCEEYLVDLNGTQAAIRAGYSPRTANEQAAHLLANVSIRTYVDKKMAERSKRTGINADRVVRELARIALINPKNLIDFKNGTVEEEAEEDDLSAISSIKVKTTSTEKAETVEREIKLHDKTKALELLGKHLGMFNDNPIINNNVNVSNPLEGLSIEELKKLADKDD